MGSHFLWKMVRRIVGVLAEVGKGQLTVDEVLVLKEYTASSQGLFFERAFYDQEKLDGLLAKRRCRPFFSDSFFSTRAYCLLK